MAAVDAEQPIQSGRAPAKATQRAPQGFSISSSENRFNAHIDARLASGYNPYGAAADAAGLGGAGAGGGDGGADGSAEAGGPTLPFFCERVMLIPNRYNDAPAYGRNYAVTTINRDPNFKMRNAPGAGMVSNTYVMG